MASSPTKCVAAWFLILTSRGYTVKVETKDGVVTLSGTVETGKAKSKAEKLTKKVRGVKGVVNELRVELPRPRS